MKKISSILIILILNIQVLDARIVSLGIYNNDSFRITTQKYHYDYLYSKIGLDVQKYRNDTYQYLYLALGIPVFEAIVKFRLDDSLYNTSDIIKPIAMAFNLETRSDDIVLGAFFELQDSPEFVGFGFSVGKAFGEERNDERVESMNEINEYATYWTIGSGIVLVILAINALSGITVKG